MFSFDRTEALPKDLPPVELVTQSSQVGSRAVLLVVIPLFLPTGFATIASIAWAVDESVLLSDGSQFVMAPPLPSSPLPSSPLLGSVAPKPELEADHEAHLRHENGAPHEHDAAFAASEAVHDSHLHMRSRSIAVFTSSVDANGAVPSMPLGALGPLGFGFGGTASRQVTRAIALPTGEALVLRTGRHGKAYATCFEPTTWTAALHQSAIASASGGAALGALPRRCARLAAAQVARAVHAL